VRSLILAAVSPDNTPHGYNWTFAFPMLLFIIIAVILYLLFSRPHRRIPARSVTRPARSSAAPGPAAAQSAAVAGGLSTAPGGGTAESHLEPHGAYLVASTDAEPTDTTPADTTQADTTQADTTPADTTPADTTPADTIPAAEAEPGDPADTETGTEKDTE
jgi:hypothetical protein